MYATYDFTNLATRKVVTVVDIAWGSFVTFLISITGSKVRV